MFVLIKEFKVEYRKFDMDNKKKDKDKLDDRMVRFSGRSGYNIRGIGFLFFGVLMVGFNFRVGKKIGCGNFGELRLGKVILFIILCWKNFDFNERFFLMKMIYLLFSCLIVVVILKNIDVGNFLCVCIFICKEFFSIGMFIYLKLSI